MPNAAIVIPARYTSSRYPGKPLVEIEGRPMILHVWERCCQATSPEQVFIATDDDRIAEAGRAGGAQVVMTPDDCLTGTDRVYHAAKQIEAETFINVQGDEPLIRPEDICAVLARAEAEPERIFNAMCAIADEREYRSPTVPKLVTRLDGRLLYMSRGPIPARKDGVFAWSHKQVCIYAFPRAALAAFAERGGKTPHEQVEDIEILRFLEMGHEVQMVEVSTSSVAVDTPEDLVRVRELFRERAAAK
ncbi:3-deoxy-manno-octulosonate cytidylyltransferase [Fodinicurvata sediminis]|uniref:3-deoxy-manno-octulosonate cytidylyltransferase n=1 Tax=Fodinicurvata sediminis TaxID=1121832 RepID=UPI0003B732D3|nr:3-deoxy-manno-octulosonate cytidylyltransferase [Fodinicurvata sediminis]